MIEPMKKLSLLLYYKEKEQFLTELQQQGVVHIEENPDVESPENISENLRRSADAVKACEHFLKQAQKNKEATARRAAKPEANITARSRDIINRYEELEKEKSELESQLENTTKAIQQLKPWGNFDPQLLQRLEEHDIHIRFFELSPKKFARLENENKDTIIEPVTADNSSVYFIVIAYKKDITIEADEISLPQQSLSGLNQQQKEQQKELTGLGQQLTELEKHFPVIHDYLLNQRDIYARTKADINMQKTVADKVLSLTGFFPAARESQLKKFLEKYTAYYEISVPESSDNVPVKLKNNFFNRIFEPITKIYSLPRYDEVDTTPFLAPFFAVFFGLCLGDLGYGTLTLLIAIFAYFKAPARFKNIFIMGMIMGVLTMVSGILLNTCFGQNIFKLQGNTSYWFESELGRKLAFLGSLRNLKEFPAMGFAVMLGVIQILLGVILQTAKNIKQKGFLWGLKPIGIFLMMVGIYFTISHKGSGFISITGIDISQFKLGPVPCFGVLSIGSWLTNVPLKAGVTMLLSGLFLVMFLNNPDKSILLRPLAGLWELYNFATGIIGDTLSYLRLFALGLASGLLANAFNSIAFGFIADGINYKIIFTVLLIIFAHLLNFILAVIGAIVHPLRLTFVEFYGNVDFSGGGKEFAPFRSTKETT
ncbi:MAG TPA: V-type ATPase 116kDa subunit family protein [Spirochaetota bacterium]|nr:V-type ATPase 116kDa subunit family protein [Spirochaetota bacterium]